MAEWISGQTKVRRGRGACTVTEEQRRAGSKDTGSPFPALQRLFPTTPSLHSTSEFWSLVLLPQKANDSLTTQANDGAC
ncbi:MAG: hypothetical protein AAF555_11875, partial [Verrucomicrobiota bacterium]